MTDVTGLRIKIFADGADLDAIATWAAKPFIGGFTTNPTLMQKANVRDYRGFARQLVALVPDRPLSFEVFSDDFGEMERQAHEIASWGPHVFVKVPVMNTRGEFAGPLIARLSQAGVQVNVTAVMTLDQVQQVRECLALAVDSFISVFAGRIADTGRDPVPVIAAAVTCLQSHPRAQVIWASPRELLNLFHAEAAGCHVITMTSDLLGKLSLLGKDLELFSLETVQMFRNDALRAGLTLPVAQPAGMAPHA